MLGMLNEIMIQYRHGSDDPEDSAVVVEEMLTSIDTVCRDLTDLGSNTQVFQEQGPNAAMHIQVTYEGGDSANMIENITTSMPYMQEPIMAMNEQGMMVQIQDENDPACMFANNVNRRPSYQRMMTPYANPHNPQFQPYGSQGRQSPSPLRQPERTMMPS